MKKRTLASAFAEARNKARLSMAEAARKCDISETTVWKVENGVSVRWETVHLILTVALKVKAGTPDYQNFHELWLQDRIRMAESQPQDFARKKLPEHAASAVRRFRKIITGMDEHTLERLMRSIDRAVVRIFKDDDQ